MRALVWCVLMVAIGCGGEERDGLRLVDDDAGDAQPDAATAPDSGDHAADSGSDADPDAGPAVEADAQVLPEVDGGHEDAGAVLVDAAADAESSDAGITQADAADSADAGPCIPAFWRDADDDGFGDPAIASCVQLLGFVANASDCYDANALAKPGQGGIFSEHRGDGSFDYDCDGNETGNNDRLAVCPDLSMATCPPAPYRRPSNNCDYLAQTATWADLRDGWSRSVPPCGTLGVHGVHLWWDTDENRFRCEEWPIDAVQQQQGRGCR